MSRIKAAIRFLYARRHPEKIAREVEQELHFHIEKRTAANIERGMTPNEAHLSAKESFGDFQRFKTECCDISRSVSFNSMAFKMGSHIALAALAGALALWAVNVPHYGFAGLSRELVAVAILMCLFIFVRRAGLKQRREHHANDTLETQGDRVLFISDAGEGRRGDIAAHDERGRTPVERMFESE